MSDAAAALLNFNMAYTDWFSAALEDGPFTYVRACAAEDTVTA